MGRGNASIGMLASMAVACFVACAASPSVSSIEPNAVEACSNVFFTGTFVNITQAYVVDAQGQKTPFVPGTLRPASTSSQLFRVTGEVPAVSVGTYRVAIDQTGGLVLGVGTVSAGSATSKQTFEVTRTYSPPGVSLAASASTGPGAAVALEPMIAGTATSAWITPGNRSASGGTVTVYPCRSTTYYLHAQNKCAVARDAATTVTVPIARIDHITPTSVAAGGTVFVVGSGFNVEKFCGANALYLVRGSTKYKQAIISSTPTEIYAGIDACVPPGTYNVVVETAMGTSPLSPAVQLVVTPPNGAACPSDSNPCTSDVCSKGTCTHVPLSNIPCGDGGTCQAGTCNSAPPPTCVPATPHPTDANLGECVPSNQPGPHCCPPAVCNYTICRGCIPHGQPCPTGGGAASQICCSPDDLCVADPVDGEVTCDVPDGPDGER